MYQRFGKRFLDILFVLSLVPVMLPVFVIIPIMIKLFDPGPVIFRQQRVGRSGEMFTFYKFRSMPVNTEDIPSDQLGGLKLAWVGQLLRRLNLDELPQLVNILKGDMSLVGPRPPIATQEELIGLRRLNGALECRPGLTGLAQVSAFDGMSVTEKAALDGEYARSISLTMDVKTILRTFSYLLKPPPVY